MNSYPIRIITVTNIIRGIDAVFSTKVLSVWSTSNPVEVEATTFLRTKNSLKKNNIIQYIYFPAYKLTDDNNYYKKLLLTKSEKWFRITYLPM